jgi:hypothetical protein
LLFRKRLPKVNQETVPQKRICDMLEFKYLISIDGWASDSFRASMILKSNSVPVIIESNFTPLHMTSWEPWLHYVPVKSDHSDLVENLVWLHNNDKKAK